MDKTYVNAESIVPDMAKWGNTDILSLRNQIFPAILTFV